MKTLKRILFVGSSIGIFLLAVVFYFAQSPVKSANVGSLNYQAKLISKSLIMTGYGIFKNMTDPSFAANPIDKDYEWEDLSHPYFERIRNDERLAHFYEKDVWLFEDILEIKEFLRDAFPHGKPPKNYRQKNVLEMLDAAEDGAKFLCSGSAKMMAQLIMAADIPTRTVRLSDEEGHGHTVLEFWSEEYKKWCLIDIDYNLHYTDMNGKPLCALELYIMSKNNDRVKKHVGISKNSLFNDKTRLYEDFYSQGFGIDFYNKWISKNYPRTAPEASPVNSVIYIGNGKLRKQYFHHDYSLEKQNIIQLINRKPYVSKDIVKK